MRSSGDELTVEQASRRLLAAIEALEVAVERRLEDDNRRDELEAELQSAGSDRSQLTNEMDRLRARSANLESANSEVSRRLDRAVETIRAVLAPQER